MRVSVCVCVCVCVCMYVCVCVCTLFVRTHIQGVRVCTFMYLQFLMVQKELFDSTEGVVS